MRELKLTDEEFNFINLMLNDIQTSPMTKEGYGYRIMAYTIQKKINGKKMPKNIQDEFEKVQRKRIKKYIENIIPKNYEGGGKSKYC